MSVFNNSVVSSTKTTVTLARAHILQSRITSEMTRIQRSLSSRVNVKLSPSDTIVTLHERVNKDKKQTLKDLQLYINLANAKEAVKSAIFKTNAKSGVSDLIIRLNLLKTRCQVLQKLEVDQDDLRDVAIDELVSVIEQANQFESRVDTMNLLRESSRMVGFWDTKESNEIKQEIRVIEKEINSINDQIAALNHKTKLSVTLTDDVLVLIDG